MGEDNNSSKECSFLNWKHHNSHISNAFDALYSSGDLCDVTVWCEGRPIQVHKLILCVCSLYFREILRNVHSENPIIVLVGVDYSILTLIFQFIYKGEVSIENERLEDFVKAAKLLQIHGLTGNDVNDQTFEENVRDFGEDTDESTPDLIFNQNEDTAKRQRIRSSVEENNSSGMKRKRYEPGVGTSKVKSESTKLEFQNDPFVNIFPEDGNENPKEELDEQLPMEHETGRKSDDTRKTPTQLDLYKEKSPSTSFDEKSLKCNICGKTFIHPYSLMHHRAVHTGSTQCPICKTVLSRKYNLQLHMKAKHKL